MHEEIKILIQQERANIDALESLLQTNKAAFAPGVLSHLQLAKHLFDDAEEAWHQATCSSATDAHRWTALTLRKIQSAGRTLEIARSLIEALSIPLQESN